MTRTWTFTDLEFVVLWERLREDRLPYPFMFTTDIPWEDDFQRECVRIRARFGTTPDPALDGALHDIARPDIAVRVRGGDGADPGNAQACIRLLAVRREDRGYLVKQLPGRTVDHSAGFTIEECDALRLADRVADALPEAERGGLAGLVLPTEPADEFEEQDGAGVWDSYEEPMSARAVRFLRAPAERVGAIEITQGISRFGPRGRTARVLAWRDLTDDGRYVITMDNPVTARGVDRDQLVGAINAQIITVVRAIKDERI